MVLGRNRMGSFGVPLELGLNEIFLGLNGIDFLEFLGCG
jgi:hypothetical protein